MRSSLCIELSLFFMSVYLLLLLLCEVLFSCMSRDFAALRPSLKYAIIWRIA